MRSQYRTRPRRRATHTSKPSRQNRVGVTGRRHTMRSHIELTRNGRRRASVNKCRPPTRHVEPLSDSPTTAECAHQQDGHNHAAPPPASPRPNCIHHAAIGPYNKRERAHCPVAGMPAAKQRPPLHSMAIPVTVEASRSPWPAKVGQPRARHQPAMVEGPDSLPDQPRLPARPARAKLSPAEVWRRG